MPLKRYLQRWLIVPIIVMGIGWQFAKKPDASPLVSLPESTKNSSTTLQVDTAYKVLVTSEQAAFVLPFDQETEYDIIISSLANATETYEVILTAQQLPSTSSLPTHDFQPLQRHSNKTKLRPSSIKQNQQIKNIKPPLQQRTFRLHVTDGSLDDPAQYIAVPSRLVGEGKEVRVYLDQQVKQQELAHGLVDDIIRLFDKQIVPGFAKQIGTVRDIDQDGKFTVFLTPWLGKLQGGKTSLDGFVRGSDFDPNIERPFGHQCDMMYLNTRLKPGKHLQSLIAHEFTHALLFSSRLRKVAGSFQLQYEEDWLNEAIAHLGENLQGGGWSNLDYRISRFLESPQSYPLVVDDYYHSGMWRNHGCRGATYLFLRWIVDTFGEEALPMLIQSPVNGTANLERVTKQSFAELFRCWNVSMLMSQENHQTINLWGHLGRWNLAGIAMHPWDLSLQKKDKMTIKGTTSAFVHVTGSSQSTAERIVIQAKPGTRLQVTLIRRTSHKNRLQIDSKFAQMTNHLAGDGLQTAIHFNPTQCSIESISVETNEGDVKESIYYHQKSLQALENNILQSSTSSHFSFTLPHRMQKSKTNLLIKAVIIDQHGNRTAARQRVIRTQ